MKPRKTPEPAKVEPERVNPADLGLALSQLPHDHELVVAARLALEVRAERLPSYDDYADGRYHRIHDLPEHTAVEKARWGPAGDRDEWVRPREGDYRGAASIPQQRTAESVARAREACQAAEREAPALSEEPPAAGAAWARS